MLECVVGFHVAEFVLLCSYVQYVCRWSRELSLAIVPCFNCFDWYRYVNECDDGLIVDARFAVDNSRSVVKE